MRLSRRAAQRWAILAIGTVSVPLAYLPASGQQPAQDSAQHPTANAAATPLQVALSEPRFLSTPQPNAPAVDVTSAPALQRRVTLEFDRVTLEAALGAITRQTGLHFVASPELVPLDHLVSLSVSHLSVAATLTELLLGAALDVQLSPDGTRLTLLPRASAPRVARRHQATGVVAGRVTDATTHAPLDQV